MGESYCGVYTVWSLINLCLSFVRLQPVLGFSTACWGFSRLIEDAVKIFDDSQQVLKLCILLCSGLGSAH